MSSESKKSKESTTETTASKAINVTQILDAANENITKLINESAKVQPQYAQAISNLQQEYIEVVRNTMHITFSVQTQLASSNNNFNRVVIPEVGSVYSRLGKTIS